MDFDETWYEWSTQGPLLELFEAAHVFRRFGQLRVGADSGRANIGPLTAQSVNKSI